MSFLGAGPQGPLPLKNDLQASAFQPHVTLSPQATGKAVFLGGRKGSLRVLVFMPLSHSMCLDSQTSRLSDFQTCSEGLNS